MILCLAGGGLIAGCMLIEGFLAVVETIQARRRSSPVPRAETMNRRLAQRSDDRLSLGCASD